MLKQYPNNLFSGFNSHLKLDLRNHSILTICLLLNAFPENYVAQCKASLRLYSFFVCKVFFQNHRKCTEHCNWSVLLLAISLPSLDEDARVRFSRYWEIGKR